MRSKDPRRQLSEIPSVAPAQTVTNTQDATMHLTGGREGAEVATPEVVGYTIGELLGKGGMGEVVLAHDEQIGREIAIKRMRRNDGNGEAETRFLREAKIQARLQHPAIVPVHEVGRDAEGRPYFTMKRLAGATLHQLHGAPLPRLLRALADVCLAIEFAHEHGVIHRDIKPANIMLGDFGEVYVLDWGVARVLDDGPQHAAVRDIVTVEGETQVGAVMGTPGYMAPEQALGYGMTPAIDVYALGCVLFEVLTGEPLHPRGPAGAARAIAQPCEAPSVRRPDLAIPPELDAACVAALAEDPAARPSARELARRIQDYLDGDRDLERRRAVAAAHVARARAALASGDPAHRGDAVHAAGRALALDPESADAAELMTALILEPPRELPPGLVASLGNAERAANRVRARTATLAFASVLSFAVLVPFLVIKSWPLLLGAFCALGGMALVSWLTYRRGKPIIPISLVTTFVTTLVMSRIAGPFVLTPVMITGMALGLIVIPALLRRPWIVMTWIALAIVVPIVLELFGVFAPTWWFDGDTLRIQSSVFRGSHTVIALGLIAAHALFIVMSTLFMRTMSRDRSAAEHRLHLQAWHLRHLLPDRTLGAPA